MIVRTLIFLSILTVSACEQKNPKTESRNMDKFDVFIQKEKFVEDLANFYPGIANPTMRPVYTKLINKAAEDFREVFTSSNPTKESYLAKMKIGLARFHDTEIMADTEDKERLCHYFEELMDMVGLQSSEGILNEFLYGFDPNKAAQ
jgi:hypothetical protein